MKLYVVGIGCGSRNGLTIEADEVLQKCDIIVGYTVYIEQVKRFYPDKECLSTGMKHEAERVELALRLAGEGQNIALVCSGDSQVYGMAGLAMEMYEKFPNVEVEVVAGVTAAISGGAVLGSPMTHDFAVISLSDLLTPMEKILKRLRCAAEGDFVIALYNPSSKKRADHLQKACDIILEYRSCDTVCGIVKNIGREGQESRTMTLSELRDTQVDMFTTVFIGNSETRIIGGKMVTPRGYRNV